nr:hypothetical protein [Tanacetum cinerariifolium]
MRELREDTFSKNKNEDAYEHVERFLDIVSLFNIPEVSHDAVMLRVFPITLTGAAKRWVDILPPGTLKENVHAIQAGCQNYGRAHLDKDCPLNVEVKSIEEAKYGEFRRSLPFSNGAKYRVGPPRYYTHIDNRPPFRKKRPSLEELMNKHLNQHEEEPR